MLHTIPGGIRGVLTRTVETGVDQKTKYVAKIDAKSKATMTVDRALVIDDGDDSPLEWRPAEEVKGNVQVKGKKGTSTVSCTANGDGARFILSGVRTVDELKALINAQPTGGDDEE